MFSQIYNCYDNCDGDREGHDGDSYEHWAGPGHSTRCVISVVLFSPQNSPGSTLQ